MPTTLKALLQLVRAFQSVGHHLLCRSRWRSCVQPARGSRRCRAAPGGAAPSPSSETCSATSPEPSSPGLRRHPRDLHRHHPHRGPHPAGPGRRPTDPARPQGRGAVGGRRGGPATPCGHAADRAKRRVAGGPPLPVRAVHGPGHRRRPPRPVRCDRHSGGGPAHCVVSRQPMPTITSYTTNCDLARSMQVERGSQCLPSNHGCGCPPAFETLTVDCSVSGASVDEWASEFKTNWTVGPMSEMLT
jgi:hypothetical protein